MDELEKLRKDIDEVDTEIIRQLKKRGELVAQISHAKKREGLPVVDRAREEDLLVTVGKTAKAEGLDSHFVSQLYKLILADSHRIQDSDS